MTFDLNKQPPEENPEIAYADKWFQRFLTYSGLPSGLLFLMISQNYLAIVCFSWLAAAIGYTFVKHLRKTDTFKLNLGTLDKHLAPKKEILLSSNTNKQEIITTDSPPPHIVCLGDGDFFAKLDRREVFREASSFDTSIRLVTAEFHNKPNPPEKVGSINDVQAEIIYYHTNYPDFPNEIHRTNYACWLNEESSSVTFNLNTKHHLILGARICKKEGDYEEGFTIFENNPDNSKSLRKHNDKFWKTGLVVVRIIAGKHGEYSKEFEFEIILNGISSYTVEYLTEEKKKEREEANISQLERFVEEGRKLLGKDNKIDDKFYSQLYDWRWKVEGFISKRIGVNLSSRFGNASEIKEFPHNQVSSESNPDWLNELYTRILNLEQIIAERKKQFKSNQIIQVAQIENPERRQFKIEQLRKFIQENEANRLKGFTAVSQVFMEHLAQGEAYRPRVERFLTMYYDKSYADRFHNEGVVVLEELLNELLDW